MSKVGRLRKNPRSRALWTPLPPAIVLGMILMSFASVALAAKVSPLPQAEAERLALNDLRANSASLGLSDIDVADVVVTDIYASKHNGLTHVYLRQRFQGIEVAGADMTLYVTADGRVHQVGHHFLSDLAARIEPGTPSLSAADAAARVAADLGTASRGDVPSRLVYRLQADGQLQLAWQLEINGDSFCGSILVDAKDGAVLERTSFTSQLVDESVVRSAIDQSSGDFAGSSSMMSPDSYQVFALPKESPDDGPRTTEVNPALAGGLASPFNWHDTNGAAGAEFTITRGNNAFAYTDLDGNNLPDAGGSPDGGAGLNFLFPLDLTMAPAAYRPAAVVNAFYWTNILHDVFWQYGFDEPGGNFQVNNYGRGGIGNDDVQVEVQDGGGVNNANFASPADGSRPRMQLYVWNSTVPNRDGALGNGVTADVFGTGMALRLVGGPANPACLGVNESSSMMWGWGDFVYLVMTAVSTDTGPTPRPLATYLLGQPPSGAGIRLRRYSTDFAVDEYTYAHIPGLVVPHGVGTVWCTVLWQLYWELVAVHGFNPNIYGDWSTGGNNLAIQLVIDGMKLVPCNPGFVDGRNAILAADLALTGGANKCAIWRAFAIRGLGTGASQGSSTSTTDGVANFDLPPECQTSAVEGGAVATPSLGYALQAHPNPFNPSTSLSFQLDARSETGLEIYDLHGRLVRRIEGGVLPAGRQALAWNGRGDGDRALASGEYIVRLVVNGEAVATLKTMLVK